MTALILFTRELAKELRTAADRWDAEIASAPGLSASHVLRMVSAAIEAAAKRAFHL